MNTEYKIRALKEKLDSDRFRSCIRLPSWATAALLAAGLTLVPGACSREKRTENATDPGPGSNMRQEIEPAVVMYAGPPEEPGVNEPPPVKPSTVAPEDVDVYGAPPMEPEEEP